MSWQLWVVIALAVAGVVMLAAARMRHARKVFDDITDLGRPVVHVPDDSPAESADELARARARHVGTQPDRRRKRA